MRAGRVVAGFAAVLVLAGCGGSSQPEAAASPSTPADAKSALTAAIASVREAGTGAFETKIVTDAGEHVERKVKGSFDLGRDLWASATSMQSWLPNGGQGTSYVADSVGEPGKYYLRARSGVPADVIDKWAWIDSAGAQAFSAESQAHLHLLDAIEAEALEATDGGSVVTGTLSGLDAATALGLTKAVRALKLDPAALEGKADVAVDLDREGHLRGIRISGADVEFASADVPAKLRELAAGSTYSNTFHGFGAPVDIFVPSSAEEIDVDLSQIDPA